jgi:hypothetical protein
MPREIRERFAIAPRRGATQEARDNQEVALLCARNYERIARIAHARFAESSEFERTIAISVRGADEA